MLCVSNPSYFPIISHIFTEVVYRYHSGVLLSTLCDKMNAIGEIGYFLASFEAVIAHLQQLDIAEDPEEMSSTALTDVSLNE